MPVTAIKVETPAVSAAGTVQFLALSQTSSAATTPALVAVPAVSTGDKAPAFSSAGPIQSVDRPTVVTDPIYLHCCNCSSIS